MRYTDLSEAITGFPLDKVVVFDTETTGTNAYDGDEVLSIAICDAYGSLLFSSMVKPTRHSSWPDAQRVNGISPRDVRGAPTMKQIASEIRAHLLGNKLVVGYNASFDIQMLLSAGVFEEWPGATFDVMQEFATVHGLRKAPYGRPGYAWSKLVDCAGFYGHSFDAHDCREDARATAHCYRALLCDEKYLARRIGDVMARVRRVDVSQTKATAANVDALVEAGCTTSVKAELRLGEVTRGANAGSPRYECFVDDRCVGVQGSGQLEDIRALYSLSDDDPLPSRIPCKALLAMTGRNARCSVEITAKGRLRSDMIEAAASDREALKIPERPIKGGGMVAIEEDRVPSKPPRKKAGMGIKAVVAVLLVISFIQATEGLPDSAKTLLTVAVIGSCIFVWRKRKKKAD